MPRYQVRTNCEYVLEVIADNPEQAMKLAEQIPHEEWDQAWAQYEAEEVES